MVAEAAIQHRGRRFDPARPRHGEHRERHRSEDEEAEDDADGAPPGQPERQHFDQKVDQQADRPEAEGEADREQQRGAHQAAPGLGQIRQHRRDFGAQDREVGRAQILRPGDPARRFGHPLPPIFIVRTVKACVAPTSSRTPTASFCGPLRIISEIV